MEQNTYATQMGLIGNKRSAFSHTINIYESYLETIHQLYFDAIIEAMAKFPLIHYDKANAKRDESIKQYIHYELAKARAKINELDIKKQIHLMPYINRHNKRNALKKDDSSSVSTISDGEPAKPNVAV